MNATKENANMNATPVCEHKKLHSPVMQPIMQPNPRPWRKQDRIIMDCTNAPVPGLVPSRMTAEVEGFILRAVNAHDVMREALKKTLMNAKSPEATDWSVVVKRIEAALKLAKGG